MLQSDSLYFCTKRINALQLIFDLIVKDSITEEGK